MVLYLAGERSMEDAWFDMPFRDRQANIAVLVHRGQVQAREVGQAGIEHIPTKAAITEARTVLA